MATIASRLQRVSAFAQQNPRVFGGCVAGFMGTNGDIAAQHIAARGEAEKAEASGATPPEHKTDFRRALSMGTFCTICASFAYVPFYAFLDRYFGAGRSLKLVVQKTAANQLIMSPFFDLPLYFSLTSFLDGYTWDGAVERCRVHYWDTLLGTWAVWVPVCIFNFSMVPLHFRVPVAYSGEFTWSLVISWISHRPVHEDDPKPAP